MANERVMVVDDEESIREWLSIALKKQGYEVKCAENGEEALKLYKKDKYDAIITDIRMPKLDGLGLLKQVKNIDPSANVIMTTAFGSNFFSSASFAGKSPSGTSIPKSCKTVEGNSSCIEHVCAPAIKPKVRIKAERKVCAAGQGQDHS